MPDVFLSYKRENLSAAAKLIEGLRGAGLDVWWDSDIPPDAPWEATIEGALAEAKVVLVCWSKAAVASDNVRSEARWAREQGRLIQTFIEPCSTPLFFGERQGVDLSGWSGESADPRFRRLVTAIQARLKGAAPKPQGSARPDKMSETLPMSALAPAEGGGAKGRRLNLKTPVVAAVAALILTLVGLSLWLARSDLFAAHGEPRVSIMSFDTSDGDVAARRVAEGTADELVNALSAGGIQTVHAAQADATFLLGGSVRTEGPNLKINARLTDVHKGAVLWSNTFEGPAAQVPTLLERTAAAIASVVDCAVEARRPQRGRPDNETLAIFLRACDEGRAWTASLDSLARLMELDREIVRRAPDFSLSQSNLASQIVDTVEWFPPAQQPDLLAEARVHARIALEDDRNNGKAYAVMALLEPHDAWARREQLLLKALAVQANSDAINWYYFTFLLECGRLKEAAVYAQRAAALAPLSPDRSANAAESMALIGDADRAETTLQAAELRWPDSVNVNGQRLQLALFKGAIDQAASALDSTGMPDGLKGVFRTTFKAMASKDRRLAASVRPSLVAFAQSGDSPRRFATMMLSAMGFLDDAFAVAQGLKDAPPLPIVTGALYAPPTAAMRRDPRFMKLAARLGLVHYWQTTDKWPDFCSEPGLPYDCKAEAAKYAGARRG